MIVNVKLPSQNLTKTHNKWLNLASPVRPQWRSHKNTSPNNPLQLQHLDSTQYPPRSVWKSWPSASPENVLSKWQTRCFGRTGSNLWFQLVTRPSKTDSPTPLLSGLTSYTFPNEWVTNAWTCFMERTCLNFTWIEELKLRSRKHSPKKISTESDSFSPLPPAHITAGSWTHPTFLSGPWWSQIWRCLDGRPRQIRKLSRILAFLRWSKGWRVGWSGRMPTWTAWLNFWCPGWSSKWDLRMEMVNTGILEGWLSGEDLSSRRRTETDELVRVMVKIEEEFYDNKCLD